MEGTLGGGSIPGILRDIYVGRKTGLLVFTRGGESCAVRFARGHIVHAQTNIFSLRMGEVLIAHGLLGREDKQRADAIVLSQRRKLGDALQELGLLSGHRLQDALALHVREILRHVFAWPEGGYRFEEQELAAFAGYDLTLQLSTGEMILEAVRRVEDAAAVSRALGDLGRVLVLSTDPLLRFQRVTLTPSDGYVLSRVDGVLSARQILSIVPVEPDEAQRSLFGLLCVGLVDFAEGLGLGQDDPSVLRREILELAAAAATRDHFQVLGLDRGCTMAEVRLAYHRCARRYHPDIHHQPELADLREKVDAVFTRITGAYHVLSDPRSRADYEKALARLKTTQAEAVGLPRPAPGEMEVEGALHRAEEAFAAGRYWDAIQDAESLVEASRGRLRQRAQVLLARCYLQNPNWKQRGEEVLLAALREEPKNAEACYLLGNLYQERGFARRAATMLTRAAELNPRYADAVPREAAPVAAQDPRGWLKKLLG
jgi:curved DNA-binding protein CbpA